jgi:hypothetical protein
MGLAGDACGGDRGELVAPAADELVAKDEIADRDLRSGVDDGVER